MRQTWRPITVWRLLGAGCAAFAVACSGAAAGGLFGPPLDPDRSGQNDAGGSVGAVDGARPDDDASAGSGGSTGLGDGSANPRDAGGRDAGPPVHFAFTCETPDAGAPLLCTGTVCCATQVDQVFSVTTTYACSSAAQCTGTDQAVIACHNEGDCGGRFCCGDYDGTEYHRLYCAASCDPVPDAGTGNDHIRFCDPKLGGSDCDVGQSCSESSVLQGYFRCGT